MFFKRLGIHSAIAIGVLILTSQSFAIGKSIRCFVINMGVNTFQRYFSHILSFAASVLTFVVQTIGAGT